MEPSDVDAPLSVLLVHVWYWPHIGGGNQHVEHMNFLLNGIMCEAANHSDD